MSLLFKNYSLVEVVCLHLWLKSYFWENLENSARPLPYKRGVGVSGGGSNCGQ